MGGATPAKRKKATVVERKPDSDSDPKPFKCDQCPYSAALVGQLNEHRKIHVLNVICDYPGCKLPFKNQQRLDVHKRLHAQTHMARSRLSDKAIVSGPVTNASKLTQRFAPLFDITETNAINYGYFAAILHEQLPITMLLVHFVQWKDCCGGKTSISRAGTMDFFRDMNVGQDKQPKDEDFEVEGDFTERYNKGHNVAVMFACKNDKKIYTLHYFVNCVAQLPAVNQDQRNMEQIILQIVQDNLQAYVFHVTILPPPNVYQEMLNERTPVAIAFAKVVVWANLEGNHIACIITTKSNTSTGSKQTKYATKTAKYGEKKTNVTDPFQVLSDAGVNFKLKRLDFTTINFEHNPDYHQDSASRAILVRPELYSLMEESEDDEDPVPIFHVENFRIDKIRRNGDNCARDECEKPFHIKQRVPIRVNCRGKWYHMTCFAEIRRDLGWLLKGSELPKFSELSSEHQKLVQQHLPDLSDDPLPSDTDEKKVLNKTRMGRTKKEGSPATDSMRQLDPKSKAIDKAKARTSRDSAKSSYKEDSESDEDVAKFIEEPEDKDFSEGEGEPTPSESGSDWAGESSGSEYGKKKPKGRGKGKKAAASSKGKGKGRGRGRPPAKGRASTSSRNGSKKAPAKRRREI